MAGRGNGSRVPSVSAWPFNADDRGMDTPFLPSGRHPNSSRVGTTNDNYVTREQQQKQQHLQHRTEVRRPGRNCDTSEEEGAHRRKGCTEILQG